MQGLQVELVNTLGGNEAHGGTLHCLSHGFGVAEVVLLALRIRPHILRRHQTGIVPQRLEFAAQIMRADAGFHPDQTRREIGKPRLHLAARPFLTQHHRAALIETNNVQKVLADIDANHRNRCIGLLRHGVLLDFGAPGASFACWRGPEHGRTIPLAVVRTIHRRVSAVISTVDTW